MKMAFGYFPKAIFISELAYVSSKINSSFFIPPFKFTFCFIQKLDEF